VKRAFFALFAFFVVAWALGESPDRTKIRVTTWNLEWFPNGSSDDATPDVQAQRIAAAADVLRPLNPNIILLQEVRDYEACARLGEVIAPGMYHVAICSAFKEPFQRGWSEPWKSMNGVDPPRGFAFAWFKIGNEDVGVYSVHLKSNLITHGIREAETAKNIHKREVAIAQLLTHVREVIGRKLPSIKCVVIGGDFNTNHDQEMFAAERTLDSFVEAGYQSGFERLALSERVTHPGAHGFPDATFDFIFGKGLTALQPCITRTTASDHLPVTPDFRLY
jgi:endonuclease/exonuclease/phosphatase family metal-dependent hydrolase